jgi:hypothetical protein
MASHGVTIFACAGGPTASQETCILWRGSPRRGGLADSCPRPRPFLPAVKLAP